MAIVRLVKATFYGPALEKPAVLEELQALGCMHLIRLNGETSGASDVQALPDARRALQFLFDCPVHRPALRQRSGFDVDAVVKDITQVMRHSHDRAEEQAQLETWIADLEAWGNYELPSWAQDGNLKFWFYVVPLHQLGPFRTLQAPYQIVSRDARFARVVVISAVEPGGLPVPPVSLATQSLANLRLRLEQVVRELEDLDYRRIGLTLYADLLRQHLDEEVDSIARQYAARGTLETDRLFAVQGWAPDGRKEDLKRFAEKESLGLTLEAPKPGDQPPTLLQNPSWLSGGEALVTFYQTPGYAMWDPSPSVFFFFALFFAMILCDAGYGAILLIALAFGWKKLGKSSEGRGLRWVMAAAFGAAIVYGVIAGSYFGLEPGQGSFLARFHRIHAKDHDLMMWLAIGVGSLHLSLANLASAWRRRKSLAALGSLGWASMISGAFGLAMAKTHVSWKVLLPWSQVLLAAGTVGIFFFSTEHPFSLKPRALVERLAHGFKGIVEISKAFGDVLSYLRLFALGLAAVMLAEVFNELGGKIIASKGAGIVLGVLVILLGHSINLIMGIMGGVVHGLRLNVIEFFNWSAPGEGILFEPFARKNKS